VRRTGLTDTPTSAVPQALRASRRLPLSDAVAPSAAEAPASPPKKKYHGTSGFQTGGFTTGRP
jgi:hypothetical protein